MASPNCTTTVRGEVRDNYVDENISNWPTSVDGLAKSITSKFLNLIGYPNY